MVQRIYIRGTHNDHYGSPKPGDHCGLVLETISKFLPVIMYSLSVDGWTVFKRIHGLALLHDVLF
jgi:hypothetical protein